MFKAFLKEYWWVILIRLGAPVLLNFIIFIPAFSPIVGGSSDWLSFYGSYIGLVIASLITLYVLYKQLQHNHEDNEKTRRDNQAVNEKMTAPIQNIELRTGETVVARGKIRLCK